MSGPVAVYSVNGGISVIHQPISFANAPTETDINYELGQLVIVESADTVFVLSSKTSSNGIVVAHWTPVAGGTGIQVINGDIGSVTGDPITFTGGTSGAIFTGVGSTMTESFEFLSLPITDTSGDGAIYIDNKSVLQAFDSLGTDTNIFVGPDSGNFSTISTNQVGVGTSTFASATTCSNSVAVGYTALASETGGNENVAVGSLAASEMLNGSNNTMVGSLTAGFVTGSISHNTFLGGHTGISYINGESSNILIGSQTSGTLGESHTCRIGVNSTTGNGGITRTFVQGIAGVTVTNAEVVSINTATGQMGSSGAIAQGTFTPGIAGAITAGTASYSSRTGNYTRIGNFIFIEVLIVWTAATGTGGLLITGLPFTVGVTDASSMAVLSFSAALGAGQTGAIAAGQIGTTVLSVSSVNAATGVFSTVPVPVTAGIVFQGFYLA